MKQYKLNSFILLSYMNVLFPVAFDRPIWVEPPFGSSPQTSISKVIAWNGSVTSDSLSRLRSHCGRIRIFLALCCGQWEKDMLVFVWKLRLASWRAFSCWRFSSSLYLWQVRAWILCSLLASFCSRRISCTEMKKNWCKHKIYRTNQNVYIIITILSQKCR